MSDKVTNIVAFIMLFMMGGMAFSSSLGDSLTMDELSHIPAGYSYLSQRDFRINPEHPPLIKDMAAFPLLFMNITFPSQSPAWTDGVNAQWWYGWELLFNSGNNADQMIFWARIPMILVLLFLGWFLFRWAKKEFNKETALLVLTAFTFSPTFLAHGRLVTTDVGAALGFVLATYFWLNFLRSPTRKNVIIAGLIFGFAMLLKFSMILLIPSLGITTIAYALAARKSLFRYILLSIAAGIIGVAVVILPVYIWHTSNYPAARQVADTIEILSSSPMPTLRNIVVWMAGKPILRALGHYFFGLMMATQRTAFGNTVYFLGMISGSGWWYYFPIVYLMKVPLAFHMLTLAALFLAALIMIKAPFWKNPLQRLREWIVAHIASFSMIVLLIIYWGASVTGNLNIGIRHILPTFPFIYMLVFAAIVAGLKEIKNPTWKNSLSYLIIFLILWYASSSLSSYPSYLSYFNEIGGGPDNGYKYVVDSNYDWGQDLKRLKTWVENNKVEKIKVDYFGGADVKYYLGDKAEGLDANQGPQKGWLAISATSLQGGEGNPVPGYDQPTGYYKWLDEYTPVTRAGKSIFIYHIE